METTVTTDVISTPELILNILSLLLGILYYVGLSGLFIKCGRKWWQAFVPFMNYYELSKIANKEKQGRVFMVTQVLAMILEFSVRISNEAYEASDSLRTAVIFLLIAVAYIAVVLTNFVYSIHIYNGLAKRFGRSRKWTIGWVMDFLSIRSIIAMIWGFNSKFQPRPIEELLEEEAAAKRDADEIPADIPETAAVRNDKREPYDLSVNIRERTAKDFIYTKTLLKDIQLSIPNGHMVLLLGGSGAGKTTFLNAITGYEKADADIKIGDGNVYTDYERMKYDIGFVPQLDLMRGNDTVYSTVADAAKLRLPTSVSDAEKKQKVDEVIQRFGLRSVKDSLVEKLSGGQRKRLSIAMEFISDPALFILDEPDSGLDGIVARKLFESLRAIADQGKIVIVITHTPDRVIDLFDDVIVLAKDSDRTGRLAYYGPVNDAYEFFGKQKIEQILLSVNQKDEGGEGKADYYVSKYASIAGKTAEVTV